MKILHVSDSFDGGGAEAVFRDTIKVSESLGNTNYIIYSDEKTDPISYIYSFKNYKRIKKILNNKPDIIHLHSYYHYLSPSVLHAIRKYKQKNACKVIFTAHDYHFICPNSGFQYFKNNQRYNFDAFAGSLKLPNGGLYDHRGIAYSMLKYVQHKLAYDVMSLDNVIDIIISPSAFLKQVFENYGVKKKINVIRNPVSFPASDERSTILESNESNKTVRLVYAGRLSEEKGILEFLSVLNERTTIEVIFDIFGDGSLRQLLESVPVRKNLIVNFKGAVTREKLVHNLKNYDIFVLPSIWYENAPISIIEAAAAGLPVICPGYGGLREMAELTKRYGFFEYDSKSELDTLLLESKRFSGENYLLDKNEFSYENYKLKLRALYKECKI
ncbi:TPA: glycosyltransferase [Klebsiella quasipneumoniae]|uniref:glycosyltransferase n=1 Tax=Klebsiella quasipneumoniae TaxID=1463165 RepID=UPI000A0EEB40|nr:glycosyltransferase [Klebsiella quasipneumoniae]MDH1959630.1 glycosyltransferase [Klebsiella quasipneumoniae]SMG71263.1 glycosyltransferase protein [Klebsiella quasipneumoniae]